jgi:hypothetical protein
MADEILTLYHGTSGRQADRLLLRPGTLPLGRDGIFWLTDSLALAERYALLSAALADDGEDPRLPEAAILEIDVWEDSVKHTGKSTASMGLVDMGPDGALS